MTTQFEPLKEVVDALVLERDIIRENNDRLGDDNKALRAQVSELERQNAELRRLLATDGWGEDMIRCALEAK
jgi:FtsZ-binding cell division protein ZapB